MTHSDGYGKPIRCLVGATAGFVPYNGGRQVENKACWERASGKLGLYHKSFDLQQKLTLGLYNKVAALELLLITYLNY